MYNDAPHLVLWSQHTQMGRGGGIMKAKIKNLLTGAIFDKTFKGNDSFEEADLERKKAQFLYGENGALHFMDPTTFEQFELEKEKVGNEIKFLTEGIEVEVLVWDEVIIGLLLPLKITQIVTYTEPGVKGDTVSSATKPATIESGAKVQVPLFVNIGDLIIVNTENGQYVERAR